jgi:excisionase family DNA binding protein
LATADQAERVLDMAHVIQEEINATLKPEKKSDLLTVSEVARILRVGDATVRRWVKEGALEAVVLPHVSHRQVSRIRRSVVNAILGDI